MVEKDPGQAFLQNLHYGAYVIISTPSEDQKQLYLYSDGFIVTRIFMKEFSQTTEEDIFGSVFRILPPFKFDSQMNLASRLQEIGAQKK